VNLVGIAPDLTTVVVRCCRKQRSVALALANIAWACDIMGTLIVSVLMQYIDLWERLWHIQLVPEWSDAFT
jgi:hypothetical protein